MQHLKLWAEGHALILGLEHDLTITLFQKNVYSKWGTNSISVHCVHISETNLS